MRIAFRFFVGVVVVIVLAAVAIFLMRKPIVAATVEYGLQGAGIEKPTVTVADVTLSMLSISTLEAGANETSRALDLRNVVISYDWRALLFDAKLKSVDIDGGTLAVALDDNGAIDIAGWSPDPNVKPAPPPFKALAVKDLAIIARTPRGDARFDVAGAFDYADGGDFKISLDADKAGFAPATISGASGKSTLRLGADGSIVADGVIKGDVETPAGTVRGFDADLTAALASWRGFFGDGPRAPSGEAIVALKSSTLDAAAMPTLAPLAAAGGAPIKTLTLGGAVKATFAEDGYRVSIEGGPLAISADRGDRLVIEAAQGPLYESRAGKQRLALKALLEGPVAKGAARLAASSEGEGPWAIEATAALGDQMIGAVALGKFTGSFRGSFADDRFAGEADMLAHVKGADIGRLRINDMPAAGRLAVAFDVKEKSLTATPLSGGCLDVDRASFKMVEQDMVARVTASRLCAASEPLVAVSFAEPSRSRVVGALTAKTAHYRLGKTIFDGAPPTVNFTLDYDPAIQTSRISGDFSGGRILLNDAFVLTAAKGNFEGGVAGDAMTATVALASMRIAQNADLEMVAPVAVSGEANLAKDIARFDFKVMTPKGQPLGKGEGFHQVRTGRGEALFDSGILTFAYGLQPDALLPALRGVVSSATGMTEGRARFEWKPNEIASSATVNLDNVSFGGPGVAVTRTEGVTGKMVFTSLGPVATAGEQTLLIRKIDLDALKLENGEMRFALPGDETLKIVEAEFPWFGGTVGAYNSEMSIAGGATETTLQIDNVDLGQLLKYPNVDGLSGEGIIEGVLPIQFKGGRAFIRNGVLSAKGGGVIRYQNKNAEPAFQANDQTKLAYEVLKEVKFQNLSLVIDGPLDGDLQFRIVFDGEGAIPIKSRGGATSVLSPIIYRLTMNVPLLQLAQGVKAAVDPIGFLKAAPRSEGEQEKAVDDLIGSNPDIF